MSKIRIIHVEDDQIFHDGLMLNLRENLNTFEVIFHAKSGEHLFEYLKEHDKPDLLLLDYQLPDTDGVSLARKIKTNDNYKEIKIVMLSAFSSERVGTTDFKLVIDAMDAGIDGYLVKSSSRMDIIKSINNVMEGETFFLGETINPKEMNKVLISDRKSIISFLNKKRNFGLSKEEIKVIEYLSKGMGAKEISQAENVEESTINSRKDNIRRKLFTEYLIEIKNSIEMVVWAIKNKIIEV